MTRMDQLEVDTFNVGPPHDHGPRRDRSRERPIIRPSQRVDDGFVRGFQSLSLHGKKYNDRNRRKSLGFETSKFTRRQSSSGEKPRPQYFELYRFQKYGEDWTVADKIPIPAPQEELKRMVRRGKGKISIVDVMTNMHHLRRGQINRLVNKKNNEETDRDAEWVPVLIEKKKSIGKSILTMDVIIAKTFKPGGYGPREKASSFEGEKSDLRVPLSSKSKDKEQFNESKRNDRDRGHDRGHDQYLERDYFAEERLFTNDGRPIDDKGRPFDGRKGDRHPVPLENPIAGPIQALQPLPPAPAGWLEPPPPVPFVQDDHHNQPPIEVLNDGPPPGGIVNLDELLEKPSGGGGGHDNQNFEHPRPDRFAGADGVNFAPVDSAGRRRSSEGRRQSGSRPRSMSFYTDRGPPRSIYRRWGHYGDSSIDDLDDTSVFFDSEDRSSRSSYPTDHERPIERRGSLKRYPSNQRGEQYYREHRRRRASYDPGHGEVIVETARTPRRPGPERRQTIAYPASPRQITYPNDNWKRKDWVDEPLSPVWTHQGDSPGFSRRRESRGPPPELYYPGELDGKGRAPDDYADPMGREPRYREDDRRREERRGDERDAIKGRRGSRTAYRDQRDGWDPR
jgi:hypothetical protein